ncbi:MAG: hypothetical protein ACFE85_16720 [Candidatus Hodarchaeota archaeon]
MNFKEFKKYRHENYLRICDELYFKSCPCRVKSVEFDINLCNFVKMYGELDIQGRTEKMNRLLQNTCSEIRNKILHKRYIAEKLKEQKKEFLEKVKSGDKVFCISEIHDVVFLEYPSEPNSDAKYMTVDGKIRNSPIFCFTLISKGNKFSSYKTSDETKAKKYSRLARRYGFRVEEEETSNGYLLRIFGDIQKEVDDFVMSLNNDLILDYYYNTSI